MTHICNKYTECPQPKEDHHRMYQPKHLKALQTATRNSPPKATKALLEHEALIPETPPTPATITHRKKQSPPS